MKHICVLPNRDKDPDLSCTRHVEAALAAYGAEIQHDIMPDTDFIVVVGGDGSILRAAKQAAQYEIPLLGVNLGRVGYMAELESNELHLLERLFDESYQVEERMMLSLKREDGSVVTALNDFVVSNQSTHLSEIALRCNGNIVGCYRADGLICATPTGSTAYSLSAGGPVVDPLMNCFCLTPICPHSLRARPMLFSEESVLEISCDRPGSLLYCTADGEDSFALPAAKTVQITKADKVTRLVRLKKDGFFETLRNKLFD